MFSSRIHTRRTILGRKRGTMGPLRRVTPTPENSDFGT